PSSLPLLYKTDATGHDIMYRTPDRIFINLARSQETGDRRQESYLHKFSKESGDRRQETGGKREDVGRNNTKSKESGDRR
ncbi:hypothetical protein, partial [Okeania hirsuta]|uniref:hypothetical protein n=1 Tax=Okeania hirsuta TaxID=1458930 RepID=UPI00196043CF